MVSKSFKLKVFENKRNGQLFVVLPKKKLKVKPKFIIVKKWGLFK